MFYKSSKKLKVLAMFMTIVMFVSFLQLSNMAPFFAKAEEEETAPYFVEEVESLRDKYSKTYLKSDGTYECIVYPIPIHTKDEDTDKWVEIDNTLEVEDGAYKNQQADMDISLPVSLSEKTPVEMKKDKYKISMRLKGAVNSVGRAKNLKRLKKFSSKKLKNITSKEIVENASSEGKLTYANVLKNTNITYQAYGDSLKESIVVNSKPEKPVSYTYSIVAENLVAVLNKDNSINFYDKAKYAKNPKKASIEFTMPAPFMFDSKEVQSTNINVTLSEQNGQYVLVYTPSYEWLSDSARVYPVTIDPTVQTPPTSSTSMYVEGTTVYGGTNQVLKAGNGTYTCISQYSPQAVYNNKLIKASLFLYQEEATANTETVTAVYPITSGWSTSGTRTSEPSTGSMIDWLDNTDKSGGYVEYDITVQGNSNSGVLIKNHPSKTSGRAIFYRYVNGGDLSKAQYFVYEYQDTTTVQRNSERTIDIGRAGTVYVSNYTGGKILERTDAGIYGNNMPVSITMIYNSANMNNPTLLTNSSASGTAYGSCYLTNYNQKLEFVAKDADDSSYYYRKTNKDMFVYTKADGTKIYFERAIEDADIANDTELDTIFVDSKDSGYKLHVSCSGDAANGYVASTNITSVYITDDEGQRYFFDSSNRLVKIAGNTPAGQNAHANGTWEPGTITIEYIEGQRISYITDGSGRVYTFNYEQLTNLSPQYVVLKSISIATGSNSSKTLVSYSYGQNDYNGIRLLRVDYPDGKYVTYTYDSVKNLATCVNTDNYYIKFDHNSGAVSAIWEYSSQNTFGQCVKVQYGTYQTVYYECDSSGNELPNGGKETIQFDNNLNVISVTDRNGNSIFATYGTRENGNVKNDLISVSNPQVTTYNLLKDGSFETYSYWTNFTSSYVGTTGAKFGDRCIKSKLLNGVYYQSLTLPAGTYTLSAYVKTDITNTSTNAAKILVSSTTSPSGALSNSAIIKGGQSDWTRVFTTFTLTSSQTVYCMFNVLSSDNYSYCDGMQLEKGTSVNRFNLLNNSNFEESGLSLWSYENLATGYTSNTDTYTFATANTESSGGSSPAGGKYLWLHGYKGITASVKQTVACNGKEGDTFSFGGWVKSMMPSDKDDRSYVIRATVVRSSNVDTRKFPKDKVYDIEINPYNLNWQHLMSEFTTEYDYSSIILGIYAENQNSTIRADGMELYKEPISTNPYYNNNGTNEYFSETETNSQNNLNSSELFGPTVDRSDSKEDEYGRTIASLTAEGVGTSYVYDDYNNVLTERTTNGRVSITTNNTYTANGNYLDKTTNDNGVTTDYSYNEVTGLLDNIKDGNNNQISYQYTQAGQLSKISQNVTGIGEMSRTYSYDAGDRLKEISADNNLKYFLYYNEWGLVTSIYVGTSSSNYQLLASYEYGPRDKGSMLSKVTYRNGQTLEYTYNNLNNISQIKSGSTVYYNFYYDSQGNLVTSIDNVANIRTDYITEKDGSYTVKQTGINGNSYSNVYKTKNIDSKTTEITNVINNVSVKDYYVKDQDGRSNGVWWKNQTGNLSSMHEIFYDDLGRKTGNVTYLAEKDENGKVIESTTVPVLSVSYAYKDLPQYRTTSNVLSMSYSYNNGSRQIGYEYDGNGNIIKAGNVSYEYDEAGQLKKVTDTSTGKVNTYQYDKRGNILSKTIDGQTKYYYYGDSTWKDLLTSYDGYSITYDYSGNPETYRNGMSFTWEQGRQLASATVNGKRTDYKYDSNGLRVRKTQNHTVIKYYYSDKKISAQDDGYNTIYFHYDSDESPIGFELKTGSVSKCYYYLKNLQGDIIGILDASGNLVVEYKYDEWGKIISITGSEAATTGEINPLRYRGYYYDSETGFYYVSSRYYDPETCRFINADEASILLLTQGELLGVNLFAYCYNNPVMNSDLSGYIALPWQVKAGLAAGIASALWEIGKYVVKNWFAKKTAWGYIKGLGAAAAKGFIRGFVVGIVSTMPSGLAYGLIGGTINLMANIIDGSIKSVGAGISAFMDGWTAGVFANGLRIVITNLSKMRGWTSKKAGYVNYALDLVFGYGLARFFKW